MAKLVSTTYGEALFELAIKNRNLDDTVMEVESVKNIFMNNEELLRLLNHPKISMQEKIAVIEDVFKGRVSDTVTGLLVVAVQKGRGKDVISILDCFLSKADEYRLIGTAHVISAVELTDMQKEELLQKLKDTTKYKSFKMYYKVDKNIIGGLVIRIGDRIVDSSIKTKLENMSKELYELQI